MSRLEAKDRVRIRLESKELKKSWYKKFRSQYPDYQEIFIVKKVISHPIRYILEGDAFLNEFSFEELDPIPETRIKVNSEEDLNIVKSILRNMKYKQSSLMNSIAFPILEKPKYTYPIAIKVYAPWESVYGDDYILGGEMSIKEFIKKNQYRLEEEYK